MLKTITFAILHFGVAFSIAYLLTGSIGISSAMSAKKASKPPPKPNFRCINAWAIEMKYVTLPRFTPQP